MYFSLVFAIFVSAIFVICDYRVVSVNAEVYGNDFNCYDIKTE